MFESLSDRLEGAFKGLLGRGKLSAGDVDKALDVVETALLEADVSYDVVKAFIASVHDEAVGEKVLESLEPGQMVVGIVHNALVELLGTENAPLVAAKAGQPAIVMMVGLQGSGKTTSSAKLALNFKKQNKKPLLVAADVYRPAAVTQLETLGKQLEVPVFSLGTNVTPQQIVEQALRWARGNSIDAIIIDTAGRLQIDERLMAELEQLRYLAVPTDILLVVDSMTGQEAVNVAKTFHARIPLTGVVLTKVDGDARGGAALSVRQVTGVPIKFMGVGEKTDALEAFYPDRMANRILGMGDIVSLVEKAQEQFDQKQAEALQNKMKRGSFDLDDFLAQLQRLRKMGPLDSLMGLIPGIGKAMKEMKQSISEKDIKSIEAIIQSMTPKERQTPNIIDASRRKRIARGSGMTVADVNSLLKEFEGMKRMMAMMAGGKGFPGYGPGGLAGSGLSGHGGKQQVQQQRKPMVADPKAAMGSWSGGGNKGRSIDKKKKK